MNYHYCTILKDCFAVSLNGKLKQNKKKQNKTKQNKTKKKKQTNKQNKKTLFHLRKSIHVLLLCAKFH